MNKNIKAVTTNINQSLDSSEADVFSHFDSGQVDENENDVS